MTRAQWDEAIAIMKPPQAFPTDACGGLRCPCRHAIMKACWTFSIGFSDREPVITPPITAMREWGLWLVARTASHQPMMIPVIRQAVRCS